MTKKKKAERGKKAVARPKRKPTPKPPQVHDFLIDVSFAISHTFRDTEIEHADTITAILSELGCENLETWLRWWVEKMYAVEEIDVSDEGLLFETRFEEKAVEDTERKAPRRAKRKGTNRKPAKQTQRERVFHVDVNVALTINGTFDASQVKDNDTDAPKLTDDAEVAFIEELEEHLLANGFMVSGLSMDECR